MLTCERRAKCMIQNKQNNLLRIYRIGSKDEDKKKRLHKENAFVYINVFKKC